MDIYTSQINESPVIVVKAASAIEDVRGKAIKLDDNGDAVIASAGDFVIGTAIVSNDENIAEGDDVTIQIRAIGLVKVSADVKPGDALAAGSDGAFAPVKVSADVKPGDALAAGSDGAFAPAASGAYTAIALQKADAGTFAQALVSRGSK